ncbi:MAG: hypothetical protein K2X77_26260 [Candidatus Obscuribacterales bacterium]|nr:hypothetical protein [Candidatus Obscuribacterales bacterium]
MDSQTEEKKSDNSASEKSNESTSDSSESAATRASDRFREEASLSAGSNLSDSGSQSQRRDSTVDPKNSNVTELVFNNDIYGNNSGTSLARDLGLGEGKKLGDTKSGDSSSGEKRNDNTESSNNERPRTEAQPESKKPPVPTEKNPSGATQNDDGSYTNPDGSVTRYGPDGSSYTRLDRKDGTYRAEYRGPYPGDNRDIEGGPTADGGHRETVSYPDDPSKNYTVEQNGNRIVRTGADGSRSETVHTDNGFTETSTGPKPEHNYRRTHESQPDGGYKEKTEYDDPKLNYTRERDASGTDTITDATGLKIEVKPPYPNPGFEEQALEAIRNMPEEERKALADAGVKISIVDRISDAKPGDPNDRHSTYSQDDRRVILAENRDAGGKQQRDYVNQLKEQIRRALEHVRQ